MNKDTHNWHEQLRQEILQDEEAYTEYKIFKAQLELAEKMKKARQKTGLTQEMVAEKMHTKKPVIARLEAAGGKNKHSPSIATLQKYAAAIGYTLKISFIPAKKENKRA